MPMPPYTVDCYYSRKEQFLFRKKKERAVSVQRHACISIHQATKYSKKIPVEFFVDTWTENG